ncbi:hypothetical protein PAMA_019185 [Pampus argenteus]
MKPLLSLSVSLWTLLVFSALLLKKSQAEDVTECDRNETMTTTTTTTTVTLVYMTNCNVSILEKSGIGSIVDLTPGAVYTITLDCFNCSQMVTTKPEGVSDLIVTEITTTSINLTWTKPTGNSSFYKVWWTDGITAIVMETSKTITNLTPGKKYDISVTAVADDGQTEGASATVTNYTKPEAVRNLSVTEITTSSVSLSWIKPEGNSTFYRVQWTDGTAKWKILTLSETQINVTALTAGAQYNFSIITVAGDNKTVGEAMTVPLYTKPEAVRNLSVTEITTSSVSLSWIKPEGNSTFYRVQWMDGTAKWKILTLSETQINVTALTAGAQYTFSIITVAGDNKTVGEAMTVPLYTKPEAVRNLSVTEITTSSVSLSWIKPEGNSTFYRVQWTDGTAKWKIHTFSETQINVTALTAGAQYKFSIITVAGDNKTVGEAMTVPLYTRPDTIGKASVSINKSDILLQWSIPAGEVLNYRIEWHDSGTKVIRYTNKTLTTLSDLSHGTSYTITIVAIAGDNKTEGDPYTLIYVTKPAVVRGLNLTVVTTSSVSLIWSRPEGNVTSYIVRWTDGSKALDNATIETSFTIRDLNPGSQYKITVFAVAGDTSNMGEGTSVTTFTRPVNPGNIIVTAQGTNNLSIRWTLPAGIVDYYMVNISNENLLYLYSIITTNTAAHFTGLYPGRIFVITVTSVVGDFSNTSEQSSFATVPTPPASIIISQRTNTSLHLQWETPTSMEGAPNISYLITYQSEGGEIQSNSVKVNNTVLSLLSSGTSYNITVKTVGPQNLSSEVVSNSTYTLPNPVLNLVASPNSTTSIKVKWSYPQESKPYYEYVVKTYNATGTLVNTKTVMDNNTDVPDLEPGTRYNITIRAIAAQGSESTAEQTFSYTMPKAVTNLSVTDVKINSIQLTWLRQSDYKPSYSYLVTVLYDNQVVGTNTTKMENYYFFSLTSGKLYHFDVLTVVEGVKSTVESISSYTRPEGVYDIVAIGSTTNMSVSWRPASGQVDSYTVLLYRHSQLERNHTGLSNTTVNTVFQDLKPGVLYCMVVFAKSGPFESNKSNVSNATFPNPPGPIVVESQTVKSINFTWAFPEGMDGYQYTFRVSNITASFEIKDNWLLLSSLQSGTRYNISVVTVGALDYESTAVTAENYTRPYPVTMLRETDITTNAVTLVWEQPESKSNYLYVVQVTNGSLFQSKAEVSNTTYTITGLLSGRNYRFTVAAQTADGTLADPVTVSYFTRPEGVYDIVAIGSTTNMSVSWRPASGQVDSYTALLYRHSQLERNHTGLSNTTVNTVFQDLKPGVLYCMVVFAKSGTFESNKLNVSNATFPNPPGPIVVESQTVKSINFTWAFPEGMDGYQYTFRVSNITASFEIKDNWFLLSSLQSGTRYDISVVTVGALDYESTAVTAENYTRPYPVTMLRQTDITTNAVTLVWEQPESKSDYLYVVQVTNGSLFQSKAEVSYTTYTITGLLSGSNYRFTVAAQTADGTLADPVTVSYFTRPFSVSELKADTVNTTDVHLNWTKPLEYKDDYNYRIETTGCASKNNTVAVNWAQISELDPGTNCIFCVFVRAKDGTEGEASCISQYTYPETVQPNISSQGSNSSIVVSWTEPLGKVDYYVVDLKSNSTDIPLQQLNSTNISVLFASLSAGRLYIARVTTHSGNFMASSKWVTTATFPNPPGPIKILMKTTNSIDMNWMAAPLMTGASFYYRLIITSSHGRVYISTTTTNHTLTSLVAGTSYNISVATVGAMDFMSEMVQRHWVTTRPSSVTFLEASTEEKNITVKWNLSDEYKESYRYNLTWQSSDGSITDSIMITETEHIINKLVPGSSYKITVTTETSDGTKSDPTLISYCTNASPVNILACVGPNKTDAKILLSWTKPEGQYYGFQITKNNSDIITFNSTCNTNCRHTISNLTHHTVYKLVLRTQSCGLSSTPVSRNCMTGITNPPIPPNYESLSEVTKREYNKFSFNINSKLLDNTNGPITHIGVLVGNSFPNNVDNMTTYLGKTYQQWHEKSTPVYLATVRDNNVQSRSGESYLSIQIGDESKWGSYTNGALKATERYRYVIVLFTSLSLENDLVDGETSLVSTTGVYLVNDLPQNPVISRTELMTSSDVHLSRSVAVRVEDYEAYYKKQKADSNCGFAEEFEDLKLVGTGQSKTNALTLENKPKNRYNNVLPYDSSRVKLSIIHGSPYDDYINANYMPGYNSRKEFIAAQGPLPTTVSEFWRMIWEKNVQTLVMLTRCNEQGRVKCEQYWNSGTRHFENITVTTTSEIPLEDWTIRDFDIKNMKTAETRTMRQFHFTAWPDHGVPETTELLISFRHLVREHMDQYSRHSPTVVHCSAGVGRTGTFIAIDRLIFQIERENTVDVFGIVHDLRMHRPLMVQTEDQYVFLNQCSMDIIRSRTGTNVDLIYQNTAALSIYENVERKKGFHKNGYHNA